MFTMLWYLQALAEHDRSWIIIDLFANFPRERWRWEALGKDDIELERLALDGVERILVLVALAELRTLQVGHIGHSGTVLVSGDALVEALVESRRWFDYEAVFDHGDIWSI